MLTNNNMPLSSFFKLCNDLKALPSELMLFYEKYKCFPKNSDEWTTHKIKNIDTTIFNLNDYYTVKQAAEKFNISTNTIQQWIYRRLLTTKKHDSRTLIHKSKHNEDFLNQKTKERKVKE
ncbi:helix-turn-helix domain-containing protein [Rickettsiales bacterium LUAb2]